MGTSLSQRWCHRLPHRRRIGALNASLFIVLKHFDNFEEAIIANTNLGGDNCHRGAFIGTILGVVHGKAGIPARWLRGLRRAEHLAPLISSCVAMALHSGGRMPVVEREDRSEDGFIDWQAMKRSESVLEVEKECGL